MKPKAPEKPEPKAEAVPSIPAPEPTFDKQAAADGWIQLFDGSTLFGFKANSDLNWTAKEGVLSADTGKPGLLVTNFELADYELKCDYRLAKGGNSGIFLRTPLEPKDPTKDCYEFNMCDSHPAFPTGSIVGRKKAETATTGEDVWKSIHLVVKGNRIQAKIDRKDVLDFTDESESKLVKGHIGLQMNGGKIEFRNVAIKPMVEPVFGGANLDGWRPVPGSKAKFDLADGTIHATSGPGFLETEKTFGDFVLQFDARTNGANLNGGLFFRAEPGTEAAPSNGYELQIHNGYKDGDRTKPIDSGTGAIFRRVAARRVIPNDNEWFRATLIANGLHFSIWVDGYLVTDWTDDRKPDPNPRKGSRTEAGHISLQAHDATTDISFRNIGIAAIP
ncbi:MAG: DUF1080 domain-containing protein [Planctomycetaceae bacterium]